MEVTVRCLYVYVDFFTVIVGEVLAKHLLVATSMPV